MSMIFSPGRMTAPSESRSSHSARFTTTRNMQVGLSLNSMKPCWRRTQASSRRTNCCSAPTFGASGRSGGVQARTFPATTAVRADWLGTREDSVKAGGVRVQPTNVRIAKTARNAYVSFS
jgi:hypothetical protein